MRTWSPGLNVLFLAFLSYQTFCWFRAASIGLSGRLAIVHLVPHQNTTFLLQRLSWHWVGYVHEELLGDFAIGEEEEGDMAVLIPSSARVFLKHSTNLSIWGWSSMPQCEEASMVLGLKVGPLICVQNLLGYQLWQKSWPTPLQRVSIGTASRN